MNSAALYTSNTRRKRVLWAILLPLGICFASAIIGTGVYVGVEAQREAEEAQKLSHVPYQWVFEEQAGSTISWPWELLAALAWTESHYNPEARSAVGARGVMQLMPRTGYRFGLNDSTFLEPVDNIRAGAQYVAHLDRSFRFVTDSAQRWRFVVASYNAGPAHIMDARRLAKRAGDNPNVWAEVEPWLEKLRYEEFYTDTLVQYGSFRSDETQKHVRTVENAYLRIRREEAKLKQENAN